MKARELWHISDSKTEIIEKELPPVRKNEVLIRSLYSMISIGTERLVCKKMVPESLYETMKVPYMQGSFALPCKYGYSLTGIVLEGPRHLVNRTVHLMHPHQDFAVAEEKSVKVIDDLPLRRSVLLSNTETAINAVWDSGVSAGDSVLITGFGIIGALIALILKKIPGTRVVIAEKNEERKKTVSLFDLELSDPEIQYHFDLAFNTSGNGDGLQTAIDSVGFEGTVVDLSWYGNQSVSLRLGESFHVMRKRIIASQVSSIPGNKQNRWKPERRKEAASRILNDVSFDGLIQNEFPFPAAPDVFDRIRNGSYNEISAIIQY